MCPLISNIAIKSIGNVGLICLLISICNFKNIGENSI